MADLFIEQLVKKEKSDKDILKKYISTGVEVFCLLLIFMFLGIKAGVFAIFVALICSFYFFTSKEYIEYEYAFTNGDLDIDCIYNRTKRKRVLSASVTAFEILAHIDDKERLAPYSELKTKDYSSGTKLGNTYVFVNNAAGRKYKVIIEPNEEMLKAFIRFMGRNKVFINKV